LEDYDSLQKEVDEVAAENDRLRIELQKMEEDGSRAGSPAPLVTVAPYQGVKGGKGRSRSGPDATGTRSLDLLMEENSLLRKENDLLVSQQSGLEQEIQRLHEALQENANTAMDAARENAMAATRAAQVQMIVQQAEANVKDISSRLERTQQSLRATEQRSTILEQDLSEARKAVQVEAAAAATARR
jgi:delta 1-pyrroline-5-carboxylate dehydrogenase